MASPSIAGRGRPRSTTSRSGSSATGRAHWAQSPRVEWGGTEANAMDTGQQGRSEDDSRQVQDYEDRPVPRTLHSIPPLSRPPPLHPRQVNPRALRPT
eukprot:2324366-Pyramimonas_sp.AAC.1